MSDLVLPIVFPLLAAAAILLLRRGAAILALVGVALSLAASLKLLGAVASGDSATLLLPGLPLPSHGVFQPRQDDSAMKRGVRGNHQRRLAITWRLNSSPDRTELSGLY